jgi:hypothetical protein
MNQHYPKNYVETAHTVSVVMPVAAVLGTAVAAMTIGKTINRNQFSGRGVTETTILGQGDWLAVGGLSKHNGDFITHELAAELGPMASLHHTPNGVTRTSLGRALESYVSRTFVDEPEAQTLHAAVQSMGLVFLLEAVADCQDRGVRLPRLGTVLAFSSPTNTRDTVRHSEAQLVQALRARGYHGGVVAGAIGKLHQDFFEQRRMEKQGVSTTEFSRKSLTSLGRTAWHSALHEQWPRLWTDSIAILLQANLSTANLTGVIGPHTTFMHCGDAVQDDLVILHTARNNLRGLALQHEAHFLEVDTPGALHGDVHAMRDKALTALKRVQTATSYAAVPKMPLASAA